MLIYLCAIVSAMGLSNEGKQKVMIEELTNEIAELKELIAELQMQYAKSNTMAGGGRFPWWAENTMAGGGRFPWWAENTMAGGGRFPWWKKAENEYEEEYDEPIDKEFSQPWAPWMGARPAVQPKTSRPVIREKEGFSPKTPKVVE